jgi:transposase-like protein
MKATPTEVITPERARDDRGHRLYTRERREELIAAYQESGLTQVAFAQREGIKYSTLTGWLQGRRRATPSAPIPCAAGPLRFVEASTPPSWRGVEVTLPDGTWLRSGTAGELAELLRMLRR